MRNILQMAAAMNAELEQIAGIMLTKNDLEGNEDTTPVVDMTVEDTYNTLSSIIKQAREALADPPDTAPPESSPYIWLNDSEHEGVAVCGCRLYYRKDHDGNVAFDFCPTHAAAPDLLKALEATQIALSYNPESDDLSTEEEIDAIKAILAATILAEAAIALAQPNHKNKKPKGGR